jgi:hypothetical protein
MRARTQPAVVAGMAVAIAFAACKYDPHPPEGEQECYEGKCVAGYVCSNGLCYTPAHVPPLPGGTGGTTTLLPGTGGKTTVVGTGGVVGSGGKTGSGGVIGYGGVTTSGLTGHGGVIGTGGVTPTGGTTTPPNAGTVVTFANYQAQGAMTGFGWIALGSADTVADPTCSSPAGLITAATPCDFTVWSSPTAYCMSGSIPAVVTSSDYTTNWGIELGVNATPVAGGVLGQSFSSVTLSLTGAPLTGLRTVVHRKGDASAVVYCAAMSPGVPVAFGSFNTACWDGSGTKLTAADVANLDQVDVQVPSGTTAITVTNLCLLGITFAR